MERLSTVAAPGGYLNLLGPDDVARVQAHYRSAGARLLDVKRQVDLSDMFRSAVGRLT